MTTQVTLKSLRDELRSLRRDIHEIKEAVLVDKEEDGELTGWATAELAKARAEPVESYVAHEQLKREILNKA